MAEFSNTPCAIMAASPVTGTGQLSVTPLDQLDRSNSNLTSHYSSFNVDFQKISVGLSVGIFSE